MSEEENRAKRFRSANFTPAEKNLLFYLIKDYRDVVENKRTDSTSCKEKDAVWTQIGETFNLRSTNGPRSINSLKKYYANNRQTAWEEFPNEGGSEYETTSNLEKDYEDLVKIANEEVDVYENGPRLAKDYSDLVKLELENEQIKKEILLIQRDESNIKLKTSETELEIKKIELQLMKEKLKNRQTKLELDD